MMKHAWDSYVTFAYGADELNSHDKSPHNWYSRTLLLTPIDSLDTLYIMNLTNEYTQAKNLVLSPSLDLTASMDVSVFETTIRILGGLEAAFELDGDKAFIDRAVQLADRLLHAFVGPHEIPVNFINLAT